MDNEQIKNVVSGVLVIDKPIGLTSHDVVQIIRRGTGIRRAGHTGTLDPRASGVLVVLLGPAVRLSEYVSAYPQRTLLKRILTKSCKPMSVKSSKFHHRTLR